MVSDKFQFFNYCFLVGLSLDYISLRLKLKSICLDVRSRIINEITANNGEGRKA